MALRPTTVAASVEADVVRQHQARPLRVCFFARVSDPELIERVGFYATDVRILKELGHKVVVVTRARQIPWDCDLYFAWWFGWGIAPLCVARLTGKPCVITGALHHGGGEFGFEARPLVKRLGMRLSLRWADAALAISKLEYKGIRALGAGNPHMVYLGVQSPPRTNGRARRQNVVLSLGSLAQDSINRKRLDNVLRAVPYVRAAVPNVRFVIGGPPGSGVAPLKRLASDLGVENTVRFAGKISNGERDRLYDEAAVLAQPTVYEGFGLVQVEAMSRGLPVVTSLGGAVSEVVGNAAMMCQRDSPKDIAEKIVALLSSEELWNRYSASGRSRVEEMFPYERRKRQLAQILDRTLGGIEGCSPEPAAAAGFPS